MKRKNILLITMDQFRADLLFGTDDGLARAVSLPHIRALMQDAISFSNHWSVITPCGPSRASLLTGQYAMNHRSVRNGAPLDHTIPTVPSEMSKAGYSPLLFGYTDTSADPRIHHPDDPILRSYENPMTGFKEIVEMQMEQSQPWRAYLADKGYDLPPFRQFFVPNGPDLDSPAFYDKSDSDTAFLTDQFLKLLPDQAGPWLSHLTYIRPHPPLVAPAPFNRLCQDQSIPEPHALGAGLSTHPLMQEAMSRNPISRLISGFPDLAETPDNFRVCRQIYLGLAAEVDHHIGRVIAFLNETGQYEETLIVLTSDHGEMLGDQGFWGKSTVFDAAFHVPLIIRDPELAQKGKIIDAPTEIVDIFPTLLEFAGLDVPTSVDGCSLYPLLRGKTPDSWRDYTWSELDFGRIPAVQDGLASNALDLAKCNLSILREKHLTLVYFNGGLPAMLFDHRQAGESRNVAEDPAYCDDLNRLIRRMLDHRMSFADRTLSDYALTDEGVVRA